MITFPQQTFAGKKRSAMEYEHGDADSPASTQEAKRLRTEDSVEASQPSNLLAGKKRTADEFDDNDEQHTASTHDAKRLRAETGPDGSSHPTATDVVDKADHNNLQAEKPLHALGSRPLPQMGRNLSDFPPDTQPVPQNMPLHIIPRYFPNHLQGHFLRRFIKEGWTWNQVFGCIDPRAMKALAKDNGLEHNQGGSVIKARYEEEMRKMAEEDAQALAESTKERTEPTEPTEPASPALPALPPQEAVRLVTAHDPIPATKDLSISEWQDLLILDVCRNRKIFEEDLGFPNKSTAIAQMQIFWNQHTQAFEDWALERLDIDPEVITAPKGNLVQQLRRMNEVLLRCCIKLFPGPRDVTSPIWHENRQHIRQWSLRRQVQEIRSWTEILENSIRADSDLVQAPRGPIAGEVMPRELEQTTQPGKSRSNFADNEPSSNIPQFQGHSRQNRPPLGYGDIGLPEDQQTRRRASSSQLRHAHGRSGSEQRGVVRDAAAGYGNGYPNSTVTYPAFPGVQTQPTTIVGHARPPSNPTYQQAPSQAGQGRPATKRPGAPRLKMFVNAPDRNTPLPPSAMADIRGILTRYPEHLSHPVVMKLFVRSAESGSHGYHTTDMVNALLWHANARDFEGITEGQRRENIRRWVVKERDACNKQLKAGRVPASLPPSMIADSAPVQPNLQAPMSFTGMQTTSPLLQVPPNYADMRIPPYHPQSAPGFAMAMPHESLQVPPDCAGMHIPIQNLQEPPSVVNMPMPPQYTQAPPGIVRMAMPYQDVQVPPNYAGMHIPPQSLRETPPGLPTPLHEAQVALGHVGMPMPLQDPPPNPCYVNMAMLEKYPQAPPTSAGIPMPQLDLPRNATHPMASHAVNGEYDQQFDSAWGGFNDASGWMPEPYNTYGTALDPSGAFKPVQLPAGPAIPSAGFEQGYGDTFGIGTEAGATEAPAAAASMAAIARPATTAPATALDIAEDSKVLGMGEAVPQAGDTFCETQETAISFDMSQLPPNEFDTLFEQMAADGTWNKLNQS
jgi:hypothetical protein